MDERTQDFIETFRSFLNDVVSQASLLAGSLSPLGELVQNHLGDASIAELPAVTHSIAAHRLVDADVALVAIAAWQCLSVAISSSAYANQWFIVTNYWR